MDFISISEIEALTQSMTDTHYRFGRGELIRPEMAATLWPYYLIAGADDRSVVETVAVARDGTFVAFKLEIGAKCSMSKQEGNMSRGVVSSFTGTLDLAYEQFQRLNGQFAA